MTKYKNHLLALAIFCFTVCLAIIIFRMSNYLNAIEINTNSFVPQITFYDFPKKDTSIELKQDQKTFNFKNTSDVPLIVDVQVSPGLKNPTLTGTINGEFSQTGEIVSLINTTPFSCNNNCEQVVNIKSLVSLELPYNVANSIMLFSVTLNSQEELNVDLNKINNFMKKDFNASLKKEMEYCESIEKRFSENVDDFESFSQELSAKSPSGITYPLYIYGDIKSDEICEKTLPAEATGTFALNLAQNSKEYYEIK
ncbi:MAG: hypothetical protein ACRCUP_06670 [Mycoplasmatales bacterium]